MLKNFMSVSYLFTSLSQFLENQGFLASVSSDNEIQVPCKAIKVLGNFLYDHMLSVSAYDFFLFGIPSGLSYIGLSCV